MFAEACRISRIELKQAAPSASNAEHLITFIDRAIDKRFDARVQTRHISASGQNADCLWHCSTSSVEMVLKQEYNRRCDRKTERSQGRSFQQAELGFVINAQSAHLEMKLAIASSDRGCCRVE